MKPTDSNNAFGLESHFRRLYEEAPLPYQSLDIEGRLLEVNQAWEEAFGYTREEAIGRFIGDFHVPGRDDRLRQEFDGFRNRGFINGLEVEFLCQDGTCKLMSVSGRIARDSQDRFLRTHCILNDITARKSMEKALQDSEEKYRLAMESTQDGLWDWNVTSGSVYYSPGWASILGMTDIRNDYTFWEDRIHPADRPGVLKTLRFHLAGETATWQEEHRLRNADDDWIWVLGRGRVTARDRHGNPLRMVGTMTDIHERKHAESRLQRSEQQLKALINATTEDAVVLLDSGFRINIVNERGARGFGKTVDEVLGQPLEAFMPLSIASSRLEYAQQVITSGRPVRFEDHRAGRWYDNNMCAVLDAEGMPEAVAIFARDITERKKIEQALAEAKEAAELANASKTRFLAAASHDLRQPLQAISSYTALLALNNTSPELEKTIGQLGDATLAIQELLEALLDISRLDSGSLKPEIKTFEVDSLLSQLWDQYQAIARDKGLMLKLVPCSVLIRSDPALLRVILQNLISNAIKYTHRGNVIIECRLDGGLTSIEIRDSGIGITEEEQALIFEEFYQHDNQARDRNKGTGIGLAIVKRMADLLNHPIRIDSVEGKGSNFAIQVPVVDIAQLETDSIHPGAAWPVNDPAGHNILLIEDDEIVLHANYSLLTTLGNKVMPAADAETARKLLTSQSPPPDIIICDYRLPGECVGTELVRRLRAEAGRQIPAIMLTGDISVTDDNCGLPDICLWMQKPARVEKLVQAINQLLDVPLPQPDDRIQG